ncbi:MAG: tripartite tricarboxylate transporter substrate binding protein [Burkholderiaceae bacterium]|nr:tripartite tricarboxylate transporter substrate binding protein [Burkholderiaceae bacterium]
MRNLLKITAAAVVGSTLAAPALAAYPDRPVTMVIPYGPGGATDISARTISRALGQQSPQPLLMVNRTGAGGATGSTAVKNADADGYTMLFARVGSHSVNPAMKATLPYKIEDFRFVGVYEINPVVCATAMNSGINSMADLMKKANSAKGAVSYSSSGVGSLLHLAAVMVLDSFGLKDAANNATHIPLKGGGAAATAVLNGTATVVCTNSSALAGFVKNKQLRPLMVTTPKRLAGFDDAPTAAELGKPELEQLVGWTGIAGPKGISDEVAATWRKWLAGATADKDFVGKMTARGSVIRLMDPEESRKFIHTQYSTFRKLVDQLGLRIKN